MAGPQGFFPTDIYIGCGWICNRKNTISFQISNNLLYLLFLPVFADISFFSLLIVVHFSVIIYLLHFILLLTFILCFYFLCMKIILQHVQNIFKIYEDFLEMSSFTVIGELRLVISCNSASDFF